MTKGHRDMLQSNWGKLCESLTDVRPICIALFNDGMLSLDEQEEIVTSSGSTTHKAYTLLNKLYRKEDAAFYVFIDACRKNGMAQVAELLQDIGVCIYCIIILQ